MTALRIVVVVIDLLVGFIALTMAWKSLVARRMLPFHEQSAGVAWDDIGPRFQQVLLALTRTVGLGFLVVGLLLLLAPALEYLGSGRWIVYAATASGAVYCAGLAVVNRTLERETGPGTPWKGSLYAAVLLAVGLLLSAVAR